MRVVAKSVTSAKGVPPWALRRREGKEETFYELEGEGELLSGSSASPMRAPSSQHPG